MSSETTPNETSATVEVSASNLVTVYANMVRGLMTSEEIVLDFGFNPNTAGKVVNEPAELTSRVILSVSSAVRLHQLLHALLTKRQEVLQATQMSTDPAKSDSTIADGVAAASKE